MTVDFLTVMSQGCNFQVLVSPEKKNEVPDNLATPIIYFTEAKTNVIFFFYPFPDHYFDTWRNSDQ